MSENLKKASNNATEKKYAVGIDLGGTAIKGGLVDDRGAVLYSASVPTEREKGAKAVAKNIAKLVKTILEKAKMTKDDVVGIGIGSPGTIDSKTGTVVYTNNLNWKNFPLADEVSALTGIRVKVANDANAAALGEYKFGAGKGAEDIVMLTLGTGVGGGVVIGGKLFEGYASAGAELGHMVIDRGGEQCTCGLRGCFETYASATALIRETKKAMLSNPQTKLWEVGLDNVCGKTPFDYMDVDESAKKVVNEYIDALTIGIINIVNIFRPQKVILGGGVCEQKKVLLPPIRKAVSERAYGGKKAPKCEVVVAKFKNRAGQIGAAALWLE